MTAPTLAERIGAEILVSRTITGGNARDFNALSDEDAFQVLAEAADFCRRFRESLKKEREDAQR